MCRRLVWLVSVVGVCAFAGATEPERSNNACDRDRACRPTWNRELNGHFFIPSLTVADAFVATVFSVQSGAGIDWVDGPSFDRQGNPAGNDSYKAAAFRSFQLSGKHLSLVGGARGRHRWSRWWV
jgi:hypothetical protein